MIYDKVIRGKFVTLHSITMEDAEFSYLIRSKSSNRNTVGQLAASLEEQQKFIQWQITQPNDYYFVVFNNQKQKIGLIGVYDIHDGIGELGREVNNGTPEESIEAQLLIQKFSTTVLHLKTLTYVIYSHNKKHLNNQKYSGLTPSKFITRNGIECAYFEFSVEDESFIKAIEKKESLLNKIAQIRNQSYT